MKQIYENLKKRPIHELLFYVFLLFIPFQTRIIYHPDSAYIDWYFNYHLAIFVYLTDILLVACFMTWILFDYQKIRQKSLFWLTTAFFLVILSSLFHVKHLNLAWFNIFKWIELLILLIYIQNAFKSPKQFIIAGVLIYVSCVSQALLAIGQFHVQHMIGFTWLGEFIAPLGTSGLSSIEVVTGKVIRAYGTLPHPNVLGAILIFGLFMGFFLVSRETDKGFSSRRKVWLIILGLICVSIGILLSFSRIAWAAAIICLLVMLLFHVKHKNSKQISLIALIVFVSCVTILGLYQPYLKARTNETILQSTSIVDRNFFNRAGVKIFSQNPILGTGAGNYVQAMQKLYNLEAWQYQPAHNIFIFISAELGVVGLILFAAIIFAIFRQAKNAPAGLLKFTLIGLGLTFLVMGQFDHYFVTIQQGRLMFFTVLGLIAALPNLGTPLDLKRDE